jgi:hypothetical protein
MLSVMIRNISDGYCRECIVHHEDGDRNSGRIHWGQCMGEARKTVKRLRLDGIELARV